LALEAPKETPKKQQLMMLLNSYARERGLSSNTTPTNCFVTGSRRLGKAENQLSLQS
jgi:hypothetical protein